MKEFNLIIRCLSTLQASRMDVITKLRIENLLSGITALLLVDLHGHENAPELEELLTHVKQVSAGESLDGTKGLIEHMRKMQTSLATCLNPGC